MRFDTNKIGCWDWEGIICIQGSKVKPSFCFQKVQLVQMDQTGKVTRYGMDGWYGGRDGENYVITDSSSNYCPLSKSNGDDVISANSETNTKNTPPLSHRHAKHDSQGFFQKMFGRKKKESKVERSDDSNEEEGPLYISTLADLPKSIQKTVKMAKIPDDQISEHFRILLHCLHFLTKKTIVWEQDGQEPYVLGSVPGQSMKKMKKDPNSPESEYKVPPEETLVSYEPIKKILKVQECVGEGGFGRVFQAKNLRAKGKESKVAVKKSAHVTSHEKNRNLREINFLQKLDHPNIVKYFTSYVSHGEILMVMEFMEGGTLTEAKNAYNFQEKHIAYAAKEMLTGISYLHNHGLAHRDLKSANIMMTIKGEVKLIDFGLCIDLNDLNQRKSRMVGSPFWMPPEMIKREGYNEKVDIWSFAICLLELANGKPPYRKSALKAMFVVGSTGYPQPFTKPGEWSTSFKKFMAACLATNPEDRANADQLLKHKFIEKADSQKSMKKILTHIFLQNTIDMMNLGGNAF